MDAASFRVLIDPLYGNLTLDPFLAELASQPEVQRLRDVRLSNINSQLLPGGANISRYEHSIGTAILASNVSERLRLPEADHRRLVCAAILHDVAITPFGHLMEEGLQYAGVPYNHVERLHEIFLGRAEVGNIDFQVFRGRSVGFRRVLERKPYRRLGIQPAEIFDLIKGQGPLGALINSSIDLDNIDNVSRMAHHIGVPFRRSLPTDVSEGFFLDGDVLCYDAGRVNSIEEWLDLRARLYGVFMTNPLDFSAKAMLVEAIRLGLTGDDRSPPILQASHWNYVDSDLLRVLQAYDLTADIIARLDVGDLYDLLGMYWVRPVDAGVCQGMPPARCLEFRRMLAKELGVAFSDVLVYCIKDKRSRRIDSLSFRATASRGEPMTIAIGKASGKVLIGAAIGRKGGSAVLTRGFETFVRGFPGFDEVERCEPREYISAALGTTGPKAGIFTRSLF